MRFECSPLNDDHIVDFLDTGHGNDLGSWLASQARRFQESSRCQVWILTDKGQTEARGFFALSSHTVHSGYLTRKQRGGINEHNPQPAQLLGKFAVAADLQGTGASIMLMHEVFKAYENIVGLTGSRFLVLDVVNEKVAKFYESFGFTRIQGSPKEANPVATTTMILPTAAIIEALK